MLEADILFALSLSDLQETTEYERGWTLLAFAVLQCNSDLVVGWENMLEKYHRTFTQVFHSSLLTCLSIFFSGTFCQVPLAEKPAEVSVMNWQSTMLISRLPRCRPFQ